MLLYKDDIVTPEVTAKRAVSSFKEKLVELEQSLSRMDAQYQKDRKELTDLIEICKMSLQSWTKLQERMQIDKEKPV